MTMNKTEWTEQTSKIGWTDVPPIVNTLLTIFKGNANTWHTPTDESQMEQLTKMDEDVIKSGMIWLDSRREEYAFSYKKSSRYSRDAQYVILNVPYTRYRRWGGSYRGITSTIVRNQFNIKRKGMEKWQAVVDEHWDKRDTIKKDEDLRQQMTYFRKLEQKVEQAEKDAKGVLSKEEIRKGALSTFDQYRRGSSGSSHGAWSFGLNYSTRYIVTDADSWQLLDGVTYRDKGYKNGDLITPDWSALSKEISAGTSITDDTVRQGLPDLAIRYTRAHQTLWQASQHWHQVMNDIYNKMKEMIE